MRIVQQATTGSVIDMLLSTEPVAALSLAPLAADAGRSSVGAQASPNAGD
jgi:hypothetical protein